MNWRKRIQNPDPSKHSKDRAPSKAKPVTRGSRTRVVSSHTGRSLRGKTRKGWPPVRVLAQVPKSTVVGMAPGNQIPSPLRQGKRSVLRESQGHLQEVELLFQASCLYLATSEANVAREIMGSFVAICALFHAYPNTRRNDAPVEFQPILFAFGVAVPLG